MPCALTDSNNYPDYLKSILKQINAENNSDAKLCACSLKTPLTDEGCPITDSDGKLVAFPFCLRDTNPNLSSSEYFNEFYTSNIGLSYKEAMKLYWTRSRLRISFSASGSVAGSPVCPVDASSASTSLQSENVSLQDLICGTSKGASISSLSNQNKPGFVCRTDSCYSARCYYFGVEFNIFFEYFIDGSRAWIDKEAQLIYPYIYGFESLNGCCGNMGPESWTVSQGNITINTNTKTPGFTGTSSGKIIVSF